MADTDKATTASTELTGKLETGGLALDEVAGEETATKQVDDGPVGMCPDGEGADKGAGVESGSSVRPSASNVVSGSSPLPSFSQPKRFSAVNINKKFLEKNSSVSGPSQSSSGSTTTKSGSPARKLSNPHVMYLILRLPLSSTTGCSSIRFSFTLDYY
jgi:hypothetical protein